MPEAEYVKMLSKEPVYLSLDSLLKEQMRQVNKRVGLDIPIEKFEQWRKEYRKIDK
jgi:hypothetical protein